MAALTEYLHGGEVVWSDAGPRPVRSLKSSVIGLVGTALTGPINKPTLVSNRIDGVSIFGPPGFGTIPDALDSYYDQGDVVAVVVNVLDPATHVKVIAAKDYPVQTAGNTKTVTLPGPYPVSSETVKVGVTAITKDTDYTIDYGTGVITRKSNATWLDATTDLNVAYSVPDDMAAALTNAIIGGVDPLTDAYSGLQALRAAQGSLGLVPKLVDVPGYSHLATVVSEIPALLDRLLATGAVNGPNTTLAAAKAFRNTIGSRRIMVVDPQIQKYDAGSASVVNSPYSSLVVGAMAVADSVRGPWHAPSNLVLNGILGTARPIDFALGNEDTAANMLNAAQITTVIRENGDRIWGDRGCSDDPKWSFINVVRSADQIAAQIQRTHLWAVSRCASQEYVDAVVGGVQGYLDDRSSPPNPDILGGACWYDAARNPPLQREKGIVVFSFDFTPCYPAERVRFEAHLVNDYLSAIT